MKSIMRNEILFSVISAFILCFSIVPIGKAEVYYDQERYLYFEIDRESKEASLGAPEMFVESHYNAHPILIEDSLGNPDFTNYWENLVIPHNIIYQGETYTVTSVNAMAFYKDVSIKTIVLPETIQKIGSSAFYMATNLKSINIPESVKSIESSAFYYCKNIESLQLPDRLESIGGEAFYNCEQLREINIPGRCDAILDNTFKHCWNLTKLIIDDSSSPLYIGRNYGVYENLAYYEYIKPYVRGGFSDCPLSYLYMGRNIVYDMTLSSSNLITPFLRYKYYGPSDEFDSKSFQSIGDTFSHLEFGDSVTEIANSLFTHCFINHDLILPPQLKKIGTSAFELCDLENRELIFPETLDSIGSGAFRYDDWQGAKLRIVYFNQSLPPTYFGGGSYPFAWNDLVVFKVPDGKGRVYRDSEWGTSNLIIDSADETTSINVRTPGTLYSRLLAQEIQKDEVCKLKLKGTLNDDDWEIVRNMSQCYDFDFSELSIENLPVGMFTENKRLVSLSLPSTINEIRNQEFKGCIHLSGSLIIPDGVHCIGDEAFWGTSVENIEYQDSIKIGNNAFWQCWNLKELHFTGVNTSIGTNAFWGSGARKVIIGKGVKVEDNAFFYNQHLKEVVFEDGVEYLGTSVFGQTDSLKYVTFEGGIKAIDAPFIDGISTNINSGYRSTEYIVNIKDLSSWCQMSFGREDFSPLFFSEKVLLNGEEMTDIVIPESASGVGSYSFCGIETLKKIQFHDGITSIGDMAFKNCANIEEVVLPKSIEKIGTQAFIGCKKIPEIDFPNQISSIGDDAFKDCSGLNKIVAPWDNPFVVSSTTFSGVSADCYLYIPIGTATKYYTAGWNAIPNVKEVGIINLECNVGGSIAYNEELIRNESKKMFYSPYRSFNILLTPDNGFYVKKCFLNGVNVTSELEGNKLFVEEPEENLEFSVIFADENIAMGDVNGDGSINVTDAICVLNHILKKTPSVFYDYASDLNDDDVVNITDAILVVHKILDKVSSVPVKDFNSLLTPQ